jgi:hypothetical protein
MAIEIYLSSDGKHTVHLSADDSVELDRLVPYATSLYEDILAQFGTKAQMWDEAINGRATGRSSRTSADGQPTVQPPRTAGRVDTVEQAQQAVNPLCPVHNTPMAYRQGKYGAFWSCPRKNPGGSWCTQTQQVSPAGNGQVATPSIHQ